MRFKLIIKVLSFFILVYGLTSCLEGDDMNTPPSGAPAIIQMTYNSTGGTLVNSGLRYFGSQALTYPPTDTMDIATFAVTLQGVQSLDKDITVTLATPESGLDDFFYSDSIEYLMMPDSLFDFVNTTAVIKAGTSYAEFKVKFYPSKIDPIQNYMLPVTAANSANLPISSNYGFVYFHVIGNPIAGPYTQEWLRWNNADGSGAPNFDVESDALFAPSNPTTITVPSGTGTLYIVKFKNPGNSGVLSDFTISFDAKSVTDAAITITAGPTITKADWETGEYEFTFNYLNSSGAARVIIDKFTKQ